ncbi:simple sugar transport system permease protein [Aeromicrobium panaciterrae]|uniref:Simple sugar transport system permease protein n=1 Tax=Aeromicrobium panaciterrae TaxID=363861 RepID=A0ABU1UR29_9ACTN|nr:ABC transporter permease [Aeromicrobium panaciterrae]MDR7087645.1 simple sugar transport system permease protein [Aeromicrobium panaciterrae]
MTVVTDAIAAAPAAARKLSYGWIMIGLAGLLVLVSALRIITGADDLDSSGTLRATLVAAIPIGLAGLGGLWSERAGIVNIGLEGMMILGTFGAGYFGYFYGPWQGVLGAILLGAAGGLLHAIATVTFGVDHIVSGVAINIIAIGAVQYLAAIAFTGVQGGGQTQSPRIDDLPRITISAISDPLGDLEAKHWFLISDVAAVLRAFVSNLSILTIICLGLFVLTYYVLWRTSFGLRLRSCGESPAAAESLGINVIRYKFTAVMISGGFAGLAGGFLALVAANGFRDGQTGGRGYIGLAAMIFGNWRPGGLLAGAGLFGYTDTLRLRGGGETIHGLLLLVAVGLVLLAVWQLRKGRKVAGSVTLGIGIVIGLWYFFSDSIPEDLTGMTPYVTTLMVLALASQRLRMPAADGKPYRKGSAG